MPIDLDVQMVSILKITKKLMTKKDILQRRREIEGRGVGGQWRSSEHIELILDILHSQAPEGDE